MRARILSVGSLAVALAFGARASLARADIQVAETERAAMAAGGMIQALSFGQHLDDPEKYDNRLYLFLNRARLRLSGHYDRVSFYTEMGVGGEDTVVSQTGVSLSLLDFSFKLPLPPLPSTYLKVGQFKVPYGREWLAYSANFQFADRSIDYLGFKVGRDFGAALVSQAGPLTFVAGVFTGGGRDIPPNHYLPEKLGAPLMVARVGIGNLDDDPFVLAQNDLGTLQRRLKGALFVNGLYTKDSLLGHSTVLNVKLADKSLLLDGNWNPYIGRTPFDQGSWWQVGGDAAVRFPMRAVDLAGETELDYGEYDNGYGSVRLWGLRAQAGALYRSVELAARYALLVPDSHFAFGTVPLTGSQVIQEITGSLAWYVIGRDLKLLASVPVIVNDPVFTEMGVGSYAATDLPDQATVLATNGMPNGNTVVRQTVVEGVLMLQAQF